MISKHVIEGFKVNQSVTKNLKQQSFLFLIYGNFKTHDTHSPQITELQIKGERVAKRLATSTREPKVPGLSATATYV